MKETLEKLIGKTVRVVTVTFDGHANSGCYDMTLNAVYSDSFSGVVDGKGPTLLIPFSAVESVKIS